MPHGDFSDYTALFCFSTGVTSIVAPWLWYQKLGPLLPFFDGVATAETTAVIQFVGGLLLFMAPVLFVNRWNTINGKAGGLGCFIASINSAAIAWGMDGALVPRGWHVFSVMFFLAALHLAFNANPMLTSSMLAEKEKKKKSK